jgi:hypothetical protein
MINSRRNNIENLYYDDAKTGKNIETVQMRVFEILTEKGWEMIRWYVLSKEAEVNPGFGKFPQNNRAFPNSKERY